MPALFQVRNVLSHRFAGAFSPLVRRPSGQLARRASAASRMTPMSVTPVTGGVC